MDDDTAAVRDAWEGVAAAWDRYAEELAAFTAPVRAALIEELRPGPEDVVLELAAGTGGLGRAIAAEVREVRSTDLAPGMVRTAAARAEQAGLENVRCEVADAQDLHLGDAAVDAVMCQMGLMLMPDPGAALAEAHRVLRPGGRIAVATWGPPQENLWVILLGASLLQHGHAVQTDPMGPGGLFSLSTPEVLEDRLATAGFRDVRTFPVVVTESFERFDDFWELHAATGGPLRRVIEGLTPEEADAVRETCRASCEAMRGDDGYTFVGQALIASGRA